MKNKIDNLIISYQLSDIFYQDLPLLQNTFSIYNVAFFRAYFDNHFFYAASNKLLTQDHYFLLKSTKIFFKKELFRVNDKNHFILWPNTPEHESMHLYLKHDYWNGMSLIEIYNDYIDLWGLTSNTNHTKWVNSFDKKFCTKYIAYLKNKCASLLGLLHKSNLCSLRDGMDFSDLTNIQNSNILAQNINNNLHSLSCREVECLKLINKGLSAKEIAILLNISVTSVQTYILRLKQKLHVSHKSDLIAIYGKKIGTQGFFM